MSDAISKRIEAVAAFSGAPVEDVQAAFRAALAGHPDCLRPFGVMLAAGRPVADEFLRQTMDAAARDAK